MDPSCRYNTRISYTPTIQNIDNHVASVCRLAAFLQVFEKYDLDGRGEINFADVAPGVASCGAKMHPQILKAVKKR